MRRPRVDIDESRSAAPTGPKARASKNRFTSRCTTSPRMVNHGRRHTPYPARSSVPLDSSVPYNRRAIDAPIPPEAERDDAARSIRPRWTRSRSTNCSSRRVSKIPRRPSAPTLPDAAEFKLPNFQQVMQDAQVSSIDLLRDVELNVKIELGRARMLVEDVLKLSEGSVVELDKLAGDPVDVFVNDRLVARGEVLVLNDNFCVRVNEIVAGVKEEGL